MNLTLRTSFIIYLMQNLVNILLQKLVINYSIANCKPNIYPDSCNHLVVSNEVMLMTKIDTD